MIKVIDGIEVCECDKCGHLNKRKVIDLWSLCEACWNQLIPNDEFEELGEVADH